MFDVPTKPWRPNRFAVAAAVVGIVIAGTMDRSLATRAADLSPRIERVAGFVTTFGLSGYMFLISAIIAARALWWRSRTDGRGRRLELGLIAERAIYFFAAIGVSGILVQIIKHAVGRTRPTLLLKTGAFHFEPFSATNSFASFPSGHTATAFSAAVALSFIAPWARPIWFSAAILIGLSRVVVHAHYPSDVVAGAALGTLTAMGVAHWFARRAVAFDPAAPSLRIMTTKTRGIH